MKTYMPIAIFLILLTITACTLHGIPLEDSKVRAILVGSWVIPHDQIMKTGDFNFKSDGTFTSYGILVIKDQEVRVEVEGKWKVEEGVLIEEITKSSHQRIVPIGLITRDTLLEVTNTQYRYRTESEKVSYHIREAKNNE